MATVYSLICFGGRTGKTVTISNGNPCVVTLTRHGLRDGTGVVLSTTGTLPAGVTAGVTYYSKSTAENTHNLYDTSANAIAGGSVPWSDIYAYQCYWLFTATGIQDDGAFISAPDTANYVLTGFKIKNTHATVPLIITSGYGVDSTGSVSALYDTTGTSIFPAPAHVVPFQTSGSYAITGDIATIMTGLNAVPAAVLSAATASPIHSDAKKVNGYSITGDGQSGSEWGPA